MDGRLRRYLSYRLKSHEYKIESNNAFNFNTQNEMKNFASVLYPSFTAVIHKS